MDDWHLRHGEGKMEEGLAADSALSKSPLLSGASGSTGAKCPKCPSCQMDVEQSKLASRAAYALRHFDNPPPNYLSNLESESGFGGSDAHCIAAQSKLRDFTRRFLEDFYQQTRAHPSPCIFGDDKVWGEFAGQYIKHAIAEFSKPVDPTEVSKFVSSKLAIYKKTRAMSESDLKGLIGELKGKAPVKVEAKPALTEPGVALVKTITPQQKSSLGRFKRLFGNAEVEWAAGPDVVIEPETGNARVTGSIEGDRAGRVEYCAIFEPDGSRVKGSYTKQVFVGMEGGKLIALDGPSANLAKPKWVGRIFEGIMGAPFTAGTQCRYCEEIQGDWSYPQRVQAAWALAKEKDRLPEEFLGKQFGGLLYPPVPKEGVTPVLCRDPEELMARWMADVAEALRDRLKDACKDNLNPKLLKPDPDTHAEYIDNFLVLDGELLNLAKAWTNPPKPVAIKGPAEAADASGGGAYRAVFEAAIKTFNVGQEYTPAEIGSMVRRHVPKTGGIDQKILQGKIVEFQKDCFKVRELNPADKLEQLKQKLAANQTELKNAAQENKRVEDNKKTQAEITKLGKAIDAGEAKPDLLYTFIGTGD